MYVVSRKYGKDPIENSGDIAWTTFSPYNDYGSYLLP